MGIAKGPLFLGFRSNVKLLKLKISAKVLFFSWGTGAEPCELGIVFRSRKRSHKHGKHTCPVHSLGVQMRGGSACRWCWKILLR